jgi:peptidoglycan/xylan/chitin deacetylase (PgdA/CDA1 family)
MRRLVRGALDPQTPILTYHAISDEVSERFAKFAVRPKELEAQVACLVEEGRSIVSVSRYADALRRGEPLEDAVVLTFDDGFRDFLTDALPILDRHGATATLYVATGYLGGSSRWLADVGEGGRAMLSTAEVREVAAAGIEIGGHSHTHRELDRLSTSDLADEITTCTRILEDALGAPVRSFAYPFGYHHAGVRRAVRDGGYASACAVGHLPSSVTDDPYALRRWIVPRDMSLTEFQHLVHHRPTASERAIRGVREFGAGVRRRLSAPRRDATAP